MIPLLRDLVQFVLTLAKELSPLLFGALAVSLAASNVVRRFRLTRLKQMAAEIELETTKLILRKRKRRAIKGHRRATAYLQEIEGIQRRQRMLEYLTNNEVKLDVLEKSQTVTAGK